MRKWNERNGYSKGEGAKKKDEKEVIKNEKEGENVEKVGYKIESRSPERKIEMQDQHMDATVG